MNWRRSNTVHIVWLMWPATLHATLAFKTEHAPSWHLFGHVKQIMFWNSRQIEGYREGDYTIIPNNKRPDVVGNDINSVGNFNFLAIDTTLSVTFGGIVIGKQHDIELVGRVGVNFLGVREQFINSPQLTYGYLGLKRKQTELLVGQYSLPLYIEDAGPNTVTWGYGSPIEAFTYVPQIRFTQKWGQTWELLISAHSEILEAASVGFLPQEGPPFDLPETTFDSRFLRNAMTPVFNLNLRKDNGPWSYIAGVQYRRIVPRLETDADFKAHEHVNAISAFGLMKYQNEWLVSTAKFLYTENGFADTGIDTYGITGINPVTHRFTYAPVRAINLWLDCDFLRMERYNPGFFIGFYRNVGTTHPLMNLACDPGYGFTSYRDLIIKPNDFANNEAIDLGWMVKFNPRLFMKFHVFEMGLEFEYHAVGFGTIDQSGEPKNTNLVQQGRGNFACYYYF